MRIKKSNYLANHFLLVLVTLLVFVLTLASCKPKVTSNSTTTNISSTNTSSGDEVSEYPSNWPYQKILKHFNKAVLDFIPVFITTEDIYLNEGEGGFANLSVTKCISLEINNISSLELEAYKQVLVDSGYTFDKYLNVYFMLDKLDYGFVLAVDKPYSSVDFVKIYIIKTNVKPTIVFSNWTACLAFGTNSYISRIDVSKIPALTSGTSYVIVNETITDRQAGRVLITGVGNQEIIDYKKLLLEKQFVYDADYGGYYLSERRFLLSIGNYQDNTIYIKIELFPLSYDKLFSKWTDVNDLINKEFNYSLTSKVELFDPVLKVTNNLVLYIAKVYKYTSAYKIEIETTNYYLSGDDSTELEEKVSSEYGINPTNGTVIDKFFHPQVTLSFDLSQTIVHIDITPAIDNLLFAGNKLDAQSIDEYLAGDCSAKLPDFNSNTYVGYKEGTNYHILNLIVYKQEINSATMYANILAAGFVETENAMTYALKYNYGALERTIYLEIRNEYYDYVYILISHV
jgi:hypothetical protein